MSEYSTYSSYLSSSRWRKRREKALERANNKCERCGRSNGRLNVHHESYDNLGDEKPSDLKVLCVPCHAKEHGDEGGSLGGVWVGEEICRLCGHGKARIEYLGKKVAVMCLNCHHEVLRAPRYAMELGGRKSKSVRSIECPFICDDKMFVDDVGLSQHLRAKHGFRWENTPAGQ